MAHVNVEPFVPRFQIAAIRVATKPPREATSPKGPRTQIIGFL